MLQAKQKFHLSNFFRTWQTSLLAFKKKKKSQSSFLLKLQKSKNPLYQSLALPPTITLSLLQRVLRTPAKISLRHSLSLSLRRKVPSTVSITRTTSTATGEPAWERDRRRGWLSNAKPSGLWVQKSFTVAKNFWYFPLGSLFDLLGFLFWDSLFC